MAKGGGTPQGAPSRPLMANVLLDEVEGRWRGVALKPFFVTAPDDGNV